MLKPVQPSGRHYVSLLTDTPSHSAATCDLPSACDIAIDLTENLQCTLNKTVNIADNPQCPF